MKICLVGSSGGQLTHLYMVNSYWEKHDRFWVTKEDTESLLNDYYNPIKYFTEYLSNDVRYSGYTRTVLRWIGITNR